MLGLQALEGVDIDNRDQGVQLVAGLLILVALALQTNAHAMRHVAHTLGPDGLVQLSIDADILSLHQLGGKLLDFLDSARGALLELTDED